MSTLLILGGGCTGLSLALRLAENPGPYTKITILEARDAYTNDRTWCFWRTKPHRFDPLIHHSWTTLSVQSEKSKSLTQCPATPYQMLESEDFYAYACEKIAKSARSKDIDLVLGVKVLDELPEAETVIDTRPLRSSPLSPLENPTLWQSFLGQEVTTDRAVFDPSVVNLMDFTQTGSEDGITFSYVLPLTAHRALIETTVFGPAPLCDSSLALCQAQTVARLCQNAKHQIRRVESGILPMGLPQRTKPDKAKSNYVRVGLMSGAGRPATGYAFQRIQCWADSCARSIQAGSGAHGHLPDPFLTRFMDKLFLQVLRNHPEQGPDIFVNLFGKANTASIIRFLSDQATLSDRASIISALPFGLFLSELARGIDFYKNKKIANPANNNFMQTKNF